MGAAIKMTQGASAAHPQIDKGRPLNLLERRLTRGRFLGAMSSVILGAAASGLLRAQPALAHSSNPPACCGPSGRCSCCSGTACCASGCGRRNSGCGSTGYGWNCCWTNNPYPQYFCADKWDGDGHKCICAGLTGRYC
jgi:hypothetical protein